MGFRLGYLRIFTRFVIFVARRREILAIGRNGSSRVQRARRERDTPFPTFPAVRSASSGRAGWRGEVRRGSLEA